MKQCKCGSYAFNLYKEDIDQGDLCDVHYWKEKALAQPEQRSVSEHLEPVAYGMWDTMIGYGGRMMMVRLDKGQDGCTVPLYTTPPQRKPLTDEMIVAGGKALAKLHAESCGLDFDDVWKYYAEDHKADAKAAIEAAHGIKE